MTAAIMLLGPSRPWSEGSAVRGSGPVGAIPDVRWLTTRREMAATIRALGIPAVVMEDELLPATGTGARGEGLMVILPARAEMLGTIFEGGLLVRDKMRRRDCFVATFVERGFAIEDHDGVLSFDTPLAKGKRTQYLRSLVRESDTWALWSDFDELAALAEWTSTVLVE